MIYYVLNSLILIVLSFTIGTILLSVFFKEKQIYFEFEENLDSVILDSQYNWVFEEEYG